MKKGEKVIFLSTRLSSSLLCTMDLTIGKVYSLTRDIKKEEYESNDYIWVTDDSGAECGFGTFTYKFERLSDQRKKKLKNLERIS